MAEETQPKPEESAPVAEAKPVEEAGTPTGDQPPAAPATEGEEKPADGAEGEAVAEEAGVAQSVSFKEESNVVADLEDPEKKALDELKLLIQAAISNKDFTPPPPPPPASEDKTPDEAKPDEKADQKSEEANTEEAPKSDDPKTDEASVSAPAAEDPAPPAEEPAPPSEEPAPPVAPPVEESPEAEAPAPPAKEEETPPPAAAAAEVTEEKEVVIEEDGAKTVEAIDETIVPAAAPAAETDPAAAETEPAAADAATEPPEEIFIWGVPLIGDEKSDTVLLKFLRARDFKVKEAMAMIKNAVIWRKQFGIESLVEEDLEISELGKVVFNHGFDKEGHPVCYNVYGEFQDKELYAKAFGDEEKRDKFLRWRIQFLEKGIRQLLDFTPGRVCTMVQVTDLKNTVGPGKKELRAATNKVITLLQDNYPEFVAKQVFINVPWWYLAYNRVISSFFTQRSKSKFVFAGPSKSSETLFKYIAPEQVPVQYGGLNKDNDPDFTTADAVTDVVIKPWSKHTIEIPATEGSVLVWEFRVLGWEVSYGAEFTPTAEDGYTVIVQKARKFVPTDEPYVKNSFKIGEPGKVVLNFDNATSKKKKLLYRYKEKSSSTEST